MCLISHYELVGDFISVPCKLILLFVKSSFSQLQVINKPTPLPDICQMHMAQTVSYKDNSSL